jgi:flavin reductase (DIM6/NTAB) family NADH-FMN oxidoreductase RutF
MLQDARMTPPPSAASAGKSRSHTAAPHLDERTALRTALGRFATGVTVICAQTPDSHVHCMTVNSFASLSLDPALILWTLRTGSARYETFSRAGAFSVNVLAESQLDISRKHAKPPTDGFSARNWNGFLGGCPIIEGASAHFVCRRHTEVKKGDHLILIGEVTDFAEYHHAPLLFMGGKYFAGSSLKPLQ